MFFETDMIPAGGPNASLNYDLFAWYIVISFTQRHIIPGIVYIHQCCFAVKVSELKKMDMP